MTDPDFDLLFPQGWLDDQVAETVALIATWPPELQPQIIHEASR